MLRDPFLALLSVDISDTIVPTSAFLRFFYYQVLDERTPSNGCAFKDAHKQAKNLNKTSARHEIAICLTQSL